MCVFVCKCISIHEKRKRIRNLLNSGFLLRQDSTYFNLENESNQNNDHNNNNNDNISNPPIYYVCVDNNAAATIHSQGDSHNFVDLKLAEDLPTYEQAVKSNA